MNRQQLQNEIESTLRSGSDQIVSIDTDTGKAVITVLQSDAIAGSYNGVRYCSTALDKLVEGELTRLADVLAARLNYLLEPICTIEAEPDIVQMRSNPPSQDDDRTRWYFELIARRGSLCLIRYRQPVGSPREVATMQLTHEVLSRLLVDFDNAAASV